MRTICDKALLSSPGVVPAPIRSPRKRGLRHPPTPPCLSLATNFQSQHSFYRSIEIMQVPWSLGIQARAMATGCSPILPPELPAAQYFTHCRHARNDHGFRQEHLRIPMRYGVDLAPLVAHSMGYHRSSLGSRPGDSSTQCSPVVLGRLRAGSKTHVTHSLSCERARWCRPRRQVTTCAACRQPLGSRDVQGIVSLR